MESLDYWRLCDDLSIVQAALLLAGHDPSQPVGYAEHLDMHKRPPGYEAAKAAITNALRRGIIKGRHVPLFDTDINGNRIGAIENSFDLGETTIEVESLKAWLISRGIRTGFFFPTATDAPDYLDRNNPSERYSAKLAAAVNAWQAVTDPNGKSPKQALTKWLREHANEFGLCDEEGKPNEQGIEDCAKVANWELKGGAPKTPNG
jgi:hypothetical protein